MERFPGSQSGGAEVGIIGFGRFGRLAARILRSNFDVRTIVFSRKREPGIYGGVEFASLDDVCRSDVIMPCVPISAFEESIKSIRDRVKLGALLVDVCSVKVYPVEVMTRYIPGGVEILATHPNFGPDSARRGLRGLKIVMHPVRVSPERYELIKQACRHIGLEVVEMSPEEHDRLTAYSLAYTHLVGRLGAKIHLRNTVIDTKGFAQLMKVQGYVVNDTRTLFRDMQNFNPYAGEMRRRVREALAEIEKELDSHG